MRQKPWRLAQTVPTLLMLVLCYAAWGMATMVVASQSLFAAIVLAGISIALHASLQHEAIHGNPFRQRWMNDVIVFPSLALVVPYMRFVETHLAHHKDSDLTDPYDDPESHYLDPVRWEGLGPTVRSILSFNNTLLGRIVVGPIVGTIGFVLNDIRMVRNGDETVFKGWLWHVPAVAVVILWVAVSPMPFWAYALAAYIGLALLKIRTFLEHRAHETARARTVIVEDRGPLSLLFLNNNFHVVHHMHPDVPWFRLPALYYANKQRYLGVNDGYRFSSYWEVFRHYFLTQKDPVAHPLMARHVDGPGSPEAPSPAIGQAPPEARPA